MGLLSGWISEQLDGWSKWYDTLPALQQQFFVGLLLLLIPAIATVVWRRIKKARKKIAARRVAATERKASRARLNPAATLLEDIQKSEDAWGELAAGIRSIEDM